MTMILTSLRGHFLKHFYCTTSTIITGRFFTVRRRVHRLIPFIHFSKSSVFPSQEKYQHWKHIQTAAKSSTLSSSASDSFSSPYLSVRICCQKDVADMLAEALLCFGASSTTVEEEESSKRSDEIIITSIFSVCKDVKECISLAGDSIGLQNVPSFEVSMHDHLDWIKATQESFHPVEVSDGLWVVPEWMTPPDLQATNIILNPGLAFGTGEHPTTKLCLLLLRYLIRGGEHFLDYGTGSGVLAIAALKFGAAFSVGFDIDPQAVTSARYNATLNNIGHEELLLSLIPGKGILPSADFSSSMDIDPTAYDVKVLNKKGKYDIVVANILLNPLLELADQIVSYAKPGATVALSGIISEQIPCILERYSEYLENITVSKMDDWACMSGLKR
ncbi:ribosomal protein L11 methyltransferase [Capsicum chacoense]|nr:ribosomal protein L11 methyltransferase [Capsicum annuum]